MKLKALDPPVNLSLSALDFHTSALMYGELELSIEIGSVAEQANQSAMIRHGDTVILTTFTDAPPPAIADFRPLTIDYSNAKSNSYLRIN